MRCLKVHSYCRTGTNPQGTQVVHNSIIYSFLRTKFLTVG